MPISFKRSFLVFTLFVCVMGLMACLKVWTLHTAYCDLGIFNRVFWAITHLGEWQWAFFGHVQPLMLLESLGYGLFPSPLYLVVLQTLFLGLPVLLLPAILRSVKWSSDFFFDGPFSFPLFIILAYILFVPIWYIGLFDFHMDHLAVPLGFGFYLACFKRRWWWACVAAMTLALVKEPFALMTAFCGIYIFIRHLSSQIDKSEEDRGLRSEDGGQRTKGRVWSKKIIPLLIGGWLFFFGIVYFWWATHVVGSYFAHDVKSALASSAFTWMGDGIGEILLFLVSHPVKAAQEIFGTPGKLIYLVVVFGSLGFLPLLRPVELIPALPILGISLLSKNHLYFSFEHHYTAGLIAPLVVGFALAIPQAMSIWQKVGLKRKVFWVYIFLCVLSSHVLLSNSPLSRFFWSNKVPKYGYRAYIPTDRERMIKRALKMHVPFDPDVAVCVQNTVNYSWLAQRKYYLLFPDGVIEPIGQFDMAKGWQFVPILADYVVLDLKRPWFLGDKGCYWYWGECQDKEMADKFMDIVKQTRSRFGTVFERDGFMILSRTDGRRLGELDG